jgi:hypothetical protein
VDLAKSIDLDAEVERLRAPFAVTNAVEVCRTPLVEPPERLPYLRKRLVEINRAIAQIEYTWVQPGRTAMMLPAPMVQIVSETERTLHINALTIGISFSRFQLKRTRNFSKASMTTEPAHTRGSTCCIPGPVGLNPRGSIMRD